MNATYTVVTDTAHAPKYTTTAQEDGPLCAICGVPSDTPLYYAHNTCSQDCARTAAIVEAINGWQDAAWQHWHQQLIDAVSPTASGRA